MTIMNRMTQLFKADMHGLLDCLEEPEAVLKQAIREMEEAIDALEEGIKQRREHLELLERRVEEKRSYREEVQGKIQIAFGEGNDSLARFFVKRRVECERLIEKMELERQYCSKEISREEQRLDKQKSEVIAIKDRSMVCEPLEAVTDEEVEIAFLQEKRLFGEGQ